VALLTGEMRRRSPVYIDTVGNKRRSTPSEEVNCNITTYGEQQNHRLIKGGETKILCMPTHSAGG